VSRYKSRRSNRNTKILTTIFSILIVLSVIFSLAGSFFLSGESSPPPPTSTPAVMSRPTFSPVPTAGVPTPVLVTPTSNP